MWKDNDTGESCGGIDAWKIKDQTGAQFMPATLQSSKF